VSSARASPPNLNPATACPICNAADGNTRFVVPSTFLQPRTDYVIRCCGKCGHHFAVGPHDDATLARVYGRAFHASTQQHAFGANSPIAINARRRAHQLAATGRRGRLLDIGAGKGYFVRAANEYFSAEGIELSAQAAEAARAEGLRVATGAFPSAAPAESFEIITLWDVLAGFVDVHAAMAAVAARLSARGIVVFTVPLVSSRSAKWLGRWWPLFIPPVNLHYFSDESIRRLLSTHGLRAVSLQTEPKQVAMDFLLRKALRTVRLRAIERVSAAIPSTWAIDLNLGDILTVTAEKPVEAGG
jgi:SAM-dependent methyltransferase